MPTPELLAALKDPAIDAIADAQAVADVLNEPIKTPRADRVTSTTLGNIWGPIKAATFRAALKTANSPLADYVLALIDGNGFEPSNASTPTVAAQLVGAGLCTHDDADAAIYVISYRCGAIVSADDVTGGRAERARLAGWKSRDAERNAAWNAFCDLDAARQSKISAGKLGTSAAPGDLAGVDAL